MATIASRVGRFFSEERPDGIVIDLPSVMALAIKAVEFYAGFGALAAHLAIPIADPAPDPPMPYPDITDRTDITVSEWTIISPLFLLYVERENALLLESSRGMGIDPYGRSSSEVAGDIERVESELPHRAFQRDVTTI